MSNRVTTKNGGSHLSGRGEYNLLTAPPHVADESHKSAFSLIVSPSLHDIIWTRLPWLFRRSEFLMATISACAHFVNISD